MVISIDRFNDGFALEKYLEMPVRLSKQEMRESVSVWLFKANGAIGFPHMGVEAMGSCREGGPFQFNFVSTGEPILDGGSIGRAASQVDADPRPAVCGASPPTFQPIDPFRRWPMTFADSATDSNIRTGKRSAARRKSPTVSMRP